MAFSADAGFPSFGAGMFFEGEVSGVAAAHNAAAGAAAPHGAALPGREDVNAFGASAAFVEGIDGDSAHAQWSGTAKNQDVSTGPLARPFARSLAPLTRSLAPDCLLRSRPLLRSLIRSLAHFAYSLARGKVYDLMSQFHLVLTHSAMGWKKRWQNGIGSGQNDIA